MKEFLQFFDSNIIWGPAMIIFLLGSHIYLTFKTGFIQKYIGKGIKLSLQKEGSDKGELSVFGSLMTALSSTIGTGNIIGVGTAVLAGGPGAVFWTWIGGLFGIATKYAETYIAVKHRIIHSNGQYSGGAMVVFEKFNKPLLAKIFAWCCALAAFGIGCATQAGAIADTLNENFNINIYVTGIVLAILVALVIFGGLKSIAKVCERLVPVMSIIYIIGCIVILFFNIQYLPQTISLILKSAFSAKAIGGGFIGVAVIDVIRNGISRGLFSNEAGMGSAPQASAASVSKNAVKPALVGSTGVFWDTTVVCLLTGIILVSSVLANDSITLLDGSISSGAVLVSRCFNQIPVFGKPFLTFGILTFAFSTILGWAYYGENCIRYLFGHKSLPIYRAIWVIMVVVGSVVTEGVIWTVADILNGAMVIPNMIAVLMLRNQIKQDTDYYLHQDHLDEEDTSLQ